MSANLLEKLELAVKPSENKAGGAPLSRNNFAPQEPSSLAQVGEFFHLGLREAIKTGSVEAIKSTVEYQERFYRAIVLEGAAMGFAVLDIITPWKKDRWQSLLRAYGELHGPVLHASFGMAFAVLNKPLSAHHIRNLDSALGNLAYDGYGFYLGCFRSQTFIEERQQPDHLKGYARNIFDQGLGRSLWFHHRGNWQKIEKTIRTFTTSRQRDLWFGIGLACTYIGNLAPSELKRLRLIAGADYNYLASGAAVAAKLRVDAGNMTECTEIACFNLAHKTAMAAAEIANTTLTKAKSAPHDEQYAAWQKQLFASFA